MIDIYAYILMMMIIIITDNRFLLGCEDVCADAAN